MVSRLKSNSTEIICSQLLKELQRVSKSTFIDIYQDSVLHNKTLSLSKRPVSAVNYSSSSIKSPVKKERILIRDKRRSLPNANPNLPRKHQSKSDQVTRFCLNTGNNKQTFQRRVGIAGIAGTTIGMTGKEHSNGILAKKLEKPVSKTHVKRIRISLPKTRSVQESPII